MLLDFEKPKRIRSTTHHNAMNSSDSGIDGTYVPNMSDADMNKWKAKHLNKGKPEARIEIRKTIDGTQVLLVVTATQVRMSMNGPIIASFTQFNQLQTAVNEAIFLLK